MHNTTVEQEKGVALPAFLPQFPMLELYGSRELLLENAEKLEYFEENCVVVQCRRQKIRVEGSGFTLRSLANGALAVCGSIRVITILDGKE